MAFYSFQCQIKSTTQQLVFHWGKHEAFKHSMKYTVVFCDYNYIPYQISMNMSGPLPQGITLLLIGALCCIVPKCSQFNLFYFNLSYFTKLVILVKYIINAGDQWLIKMAFSEKCSKHVLSSIFYSDLGLRRITQFFVSCLMIFPPTAEIALKQNKLKRKEIRRKKRLIGNKLSI